MSSASGPLVTKKDTLDELRLVERAAYAAKTEKAVAALPEAEQSAFLSARQALSTGIRKLSKAKMADIRKELEANAKELSDGIDSLTKSLGDLEKAVRWAMAINKVVGVLGRVVSIFV